MRVWAHVFTALALSFTATMAVAGNTLLCEPGQEPGLADLGSGIAEAPTPPEQVCPEPQFDDFDVEILVNSDDRVDVRGLGDPTQLAITTVRTTGALHGKRVLISGDPVHADVQENLCRMLQSRDIEVYRHGDNAAVRQEMVRVVAPRRAYALSGTDTIWLNLSDRTLDIPAVGSMRRVAWASHEEGIVDIIQGLVTSQTEDDDSTGAVVLVDAAGDLKYQLQELDFSDVDAVVYYVDGGKAAWNEWHRFNWRVNRGRESVAGVATCIAQ